MRTLTWNGRDRGCYRTFYLIINQADAQQALWLRWVLHVPKQSFAPATITQWTMLSSAEGVIATEKSTLAQGDDVTHERWQAITEQLHAGKVELRSEQLGAITAEWTPGDASYGLYPYEWMYRASWPTTKALTPEPSITAHARAQYNGRDYTFTNAPAVLGHFGGTRMAESWTWMHCNHFVEDPNAHCELLSAKIALGPATSPALTLARVHVNGEDYCFNEPLQWLQAESNGDALGWNADMHNGSHRLWLRLVAPAQSMIGLTYSAPDLSRRYCYHSDFAHLYCMLAKKVGSDWETCAQFHSSFAARFETVSREAVSNLALHL